MEPHSDEEHLVTKNLKGLGLDRPTYRFGTPRLRVGSRFVRITRWTLPVLVVIVVLIVAARLIGGTAAWQSFASTNPCFLAANGVFDYPGWLRAMHWFNVLLMLVFIKSGIQILADHPRLYTNIHSTPDREWLRFRGPVPSDRVWTALDDSTHLTPAIGLPGGRHTSGMARHWHFFGVAFWIALGALYGILLFATGQWRQIVPTTIEVVPSALTCGVTYGGLSLPPGEAGMAMNSLQLLTYFAVVFIAAPLAILTGLAQAPTVSHHYRWFIKLFGNRQIARSLHFLIWVFFCLFIVVHVLLVIVTGFTKNMNHIVLNNDGTSWTGAIVGILILVVIFLLLNAANWLSWAHPRKVQNGFQRIAGRTNRLVFGRMVPRVNMSEKDISPYMWTNGPVPDSAEFEALRAGDFREYRLKVGGLVANPREFSLDELRALGDKKEQITEHDCVQGWSGVAKWGGIPVGKVLDEVRPLPEARFAVFLAHGADGAKAPYYDVHDLWQMREPDSILAWEMNGQPLPLHHGSPLRLRNERQVGFKQVKWIKSIELVASYSDLFQGQGGYREDTEFQARSAEM